MTADQPRLPWANMFDPEQVTEASEEVADRQRQMFEQWMSMANPTGPSDSLTDLGALCTTTATFKSRVQSGGRLSIPDAEREALGIEEGDIVQTIVIPVGRNSDE